MSYFERSLEQLELNLPVNPETNPWSDERLALLRLYLPKNSAAQTAAFINKETGSAFSRNAVIGKAGRIGLKGHIAHPNKAPRKPRKTNWLRPYRIAQKNAQATTPRSQEAIVQHVAPSIEHQKTIDQLGNCDCRWILGDVNGAATLYCGVPEADLIEGYSFCGFHSRLVYAPSRRAA